MHGNDLTVCWLRFRWWTQRENDHFEWFLLNSRAAGVLSKGVGWLSRTSVARKSWDGFVKYVVNGQHILSSRVSPSQRWWQLGLWEGLGRSSFIPKTHLSEMLGITLRSSDSQPVRFAHPSFSLSWVSLILFANLSGSGSTFPLRQKSPPGFHSSSFFIRMASRSFGEKQSKFKDYVPRHKCIFKKCRLHKHLLFCRWEFLCLFSLLPSFLCLRPGFKCKLSRPSAIWSVLEPL